MTRNGIAIQPLRSSITGQVIMPEDTEYDAARSTFYGGISRHPAAIVRVANATDVSHVITFAREKRFGARHPQRWTQHGRS